MSFAATRSSGGNHRSHSNSNLHNSNNNNNNSNNSSGSNHHHHNHSHPHPHQHQSQHPHQHHSHHHHHQQQQQSHHHLQPLVTAGGSSSSSVSSTSSSSASQQQHQHHHQHHHHHQQQHLSAAAVAPIDPNDTQLTTTITAGHASTTATAACSGPPHYVDLHVNAGECVSLQLFDGQEQLVAGPATITLVSQQQNPPVPIPVQVPPGHMIHQIADENGTLKHIILSVMDPSAPPADAAGSLESTVITLPQTGGGASIGLGMSFWNGNQSGTLYQPPSYNNNNNSNENHNNNSTAVAGGIQSNYHQPLSATGPPNGAANNHIYHNGKPALPSAGGYPASTASTLNNHGPAHYRTGGRGSGSISPMRSRAKHHHNHNHHHHHHHNNHSHSNNHHHHHNNNVQSNRTHYHPSPINGNNHQSSYNHAAASFEVAASSPQLAPASKIPEAGVAKQAQAAISLANRQQLAAPVQVQDNTGSVWQSANKLNHDQQQVQSKSLSPASGSTKRRQQKAAASPSPSPSTTATSQETNGNNKVGSSNKTNTKQQKRDSSSTKSVEGRLSNDRQQQVTVEATTPLEPDTPRVSRGKQKKQQQAVSETETQVDEIRIEVQPVEKLAVEDVASESQQEPAVAEAEMEETSIVEKESAAAATNQPAAVVKGHSQPTTTEPEKEAEDEDKDDSDDVPASLQKKKSASVESSKRRRPSKSVESSKPAGSAVALGGLKLNALPQLKLLNLSCTSITSSSVQLRWSYLPGATDKYGIQQQHHHHSKHTHILDHFVIETSAEKNADTNQLVAPRVVYQGCAMTCRVAHLQVDKIHHFRVRRTALVNAATESGCASIKQEHLVVSEILSVTLASIQQPAQQQHQQPQQSKKKGGPAAAGMVISASNNVAIRGNASSHNNNNNSNHNHNPNHHQHHHNHNHGGSSIKLSNLSRHCRAKFVSMFERMVKNSLSSCSDTKFAGMLLVLFTIFAMLLAIFIHFYFVAPVID